MKMTERIKNVIRGMGSILNPDPLPEWNEPDWSPILTDTELLAMSCKLMEEVVHSHSDEESSDYNDCGTKETDCRWCFEAKRIMDLNGKRRQSDLTAKEDKSCG